MQTVQIVLDKKLLVATDKAAKRAKQNRSALVREALREHLRKLEIRAKEDKLIEAYRRQPETEEELAWLEAGEWPDE